MAKQLRHCGNLGGMVQIVARFVFEVM